jgi:hypothetical protein
MREMGSLGPRCEINNEFWINFTQAVPLPPTCLGLELISLTCFMQFSFKVNPNVDLMKLRGDQRTNKTPYMVALTDVSLSPRLPPWPSQQLFLAARSWGGSTTGCAGSLGLPIRRGPKINSSTNPVNGKRTRVIGLGGQ